ncbi:MAG: TolC family protein [Methylobacter sp.]|nr:TolC family protein [Methylobacter sp.]
MKSYFFSLALLPVCCAQAETLEEALEHAVSQNHLIKSAKADTEASKQQLYSAQNQRLPALNINSGYTQLSEAPAAKTQIEGQSAQFVTAQAGSAQAQAIATLPIFTSGRISHNINASEASLSAVQHNEITTALTIKMQVAEVYLSVLRAQSALQLAQSHAETLQAHAADVDRLHSQGMVSKNDQLAAEVEYANARQLVVQSGNRLDIAKAQYNRLLNRRLDDSVELEDRFPASPDGAPDELNAQALVQRPELNALTNQITTLQEQAQSVQASLLPQVAVNGGYQYQENRFQAFEGMWMVNVGMEWKLDGGTHHQSKSLHRQALALQAQRDDLAGMIGLEIRRAWLDIQETEKRIDVSKQAIAQADENLRVNQERYRQGLSSQTEMLKAEELRMTTHDNFNNAHYDAAQAKLSLRRALGVL